MGIDIKIFAIPLEEIRLLLHDGAKNEDGLKKLVEKMLLKNVFIKDEDVQKTLDALKSSINKNLDLDKLIFGYKNEELRGTVFFPIEGFTPYYHIFSKILDVLDVCTDKKNKVYLKIKEINNMENDEAADKDYRNFMESEFCIKSGQFSQCYFYIVPLELDKIPIDIFENVKDESGKGHKYEICDLKNFEKEVLAKLDKKEIYDNTWFIQQIINLIKNMKKSGVSYLAYTVS